jgi:hypothetical protein
MEAGLPIAPFVCGLALNAHERVGNGLEPFLGDTLPALHAEAVFVLLDARQGRIDGPEPFEVLGADGFNHLAVYIIGGNVSQVFGVHAFHYFLEIRVADHQISDDLLLKLSQRLFHLRYELLIHDGLPSPGLPGVSLV